MELHSTLAIIQARMGSTRLPGKVLQEIAGLPMLAREVLRTRRARSVSQVLIATTTDPADDILFDYCRAHGFPAITRPPAFTRLRSCSASRPIVP